MFQGAGRAEPQGKQVSQGKQGSGHFLWIENRFEDQVHIQAPALRFHHQSYRFSGQNHSLEEQARAVGEFLQSASVQEPVNTHHAAVDEFRQIIGTDPPFVFPVAVLVDHFRQPGRVKP